MPKRAGIARSIVTVDSFYPKASRLRGHFDERFAEPRSADAGRFVWDYWHVPDQYTLLRTPAYHFFPKKVYEDLHRSLVLWGRENLGCHDISPPWMSCYVDGCEQNLHGDLPHGPWAFVFSLTPWKTRRFKGGETLLLKEPILSYWSRFQGGGMGAGGMEHGDIFESVPALFNRLTVFDPRIPHGVKRVEGVSDVRQGRLVIHGWFVQPRPFIEGALAPKALQSAIEGMNERLAALLSHGVPVNGVLSLRLEVSSVGKVTALRALTNSLRSPDPAIAALLLREIRAYLQSRSFGRRRGPSRVTLPIVFEA